nr:MAG TPA: hypothetical protein [Crassvirales sp.]
MAKGTLSKSSVLLMKYLLSDTRISDKVFNNQKDKSKYKSVSIREDGSILLGKTSYPFWNQLLSCQIEIPFNDFALKVWDALVNLSVGDNSIALEEGLSTEIAKLSQRNGDYDLVVKRLFDCYEHVCNNKDEASSAGDSVKSELESRFVNGTNVPKNIVINVNGMERRVIPFRDSAGDKFIDIEYGVSDVTVH